jgi:hypothetical protein
VDFTDQQIEMAAIPETFGQERGAKSLDVALHFRIEMS